MTTMRAIIIERPGGPEVLQERRLPIPRATPGTVVVRVRALGVNHAEVYFRKGAWGEVAKISGIECAGEVHDPGDSGLALGRRVVALMGGMGRTIDGSYAEYVRVPAAHVIAVETRLGWAELAALPESYATAWTVLQHNLAAQAGQVVVIRGGTSALGQAAINLARVLELRVLATTRSPDRASIIETLGADVLVDTGAVASEVRRRYPGGVDAVLDIVGTRTLIDSLGMVRYGGRVAMAGFLGGGQPLDAFDPLAHLPSGVQLSFFASAFLFGTAAVPMASLPFQTFIDWAETGRVAAHPAHRFELGELAEAHRLMESGQARGKIVAEVA